MLTLRSVISWYQLYFGTGGQGFVFAIALIFLIVTRHVRRENRQIRLLCSYGILISGICSVCWVHMFDEAEE